MMRYKCGIVPIDDAVVSYRFKRLRWVNYVQVIAIHLQECRDAHADVNGK